MKQIKRIYGIILMVGFLLESCVFPAVNFDELRGDSYLTVETEIHNGDGLNFVKLSSSANSVLRGTALPISDAIVFLLDKSGKRYDFTWDVTVPGRYIPAGAFKGEVGNSYQVHIETVSGDVYESDFEEIKPVPEIKQVYSEFKIKPELNDVDALKNGWDVFIDFQDLPESGNFYQWSYSHYEKLEICTSCTNGGTYDFYNNECRIPRRSLSSATTNYRCEGNCWELIKNKDLLVFSDILTNGQEVVGKKILRVPYDGSSKYYLKVEQRAINPSAYNFFASIVNSYQNAGSLFDIPAVTNFSVNIRCTNHPEKKVLGVFNVYGLSSKIIIIDRYNQVPPNINPIKTPLDGSIFECPIGGPAGCKDKTPCVESETRTSVSPENWQD